MREMQQLRELNAYMKEISNEDENKDEEKMREGPAQVKLNEITVQPINVQVIVPEEPPKPSVEPPKKTLKEIMSQS